MRDEGPTMDGRLSEPGRRRRRLGRGIIDVLMVLLLCAAMLKLLDVPHFADAVRTWPFVPGRAAYVVALGVANLEVVVALGWLLRLFPRAAFALAASGLVVSIGVFAAFVGSATPPRCGCFGILEQHYARIGSAEHVVVRNAVVLAILGAGGGLAWFRATPRTRPPDPVRISRPTGFSIIEVVMSVALVAVLLSLIAPALTGMRERGEAAVSLSNMRQHATTFAVYAVDFDDQYPYFVYRDADAVVRCESEAVVIGHWSAYAFWNLALAADYYDERCAHPTFYPPGYPSGLSDAVPSGVTPYYYGCSFIAAAAYWSPSRRTGAEQWGATRHSEVTFPAKKGLFFAHYPLVVQRAGAPTEGGAGFELPIGFTDGHAAPVRLDRVRAGYPRGDGGFGGGAHHLNSGPAGLHTLDGVRGRDID